MILSQKLVIICKEGGRKFEETINTFMAHIMMMTLWYICISQHVKLYTLNMYRFCISIIS